MDLENRFLAWNVKKSDWGKIIDYLIAEDFYNESRFIEAFVRGKFRIKKWGRNKIILELAKSKVVGKLVRDAMKKEISEEDYLNTIKELLKRKSQLINEEEGLKKRDKLYRFMLNKGFESELIVKELNAI